MNKRICAALCSLLCLLLAVVSCGVPVFAAQEEAAETTPAAEEILLEIADEMQFLQFVQNCRIDSYSKGLTVLLKADLDLSGYAFESIPIFCGTFRGNSHTIQGVTLTAAGSAQGLFRYLTQEAVLFLAVPRFLSVLCFVSIHLSFQAPHNYQLHKFHYYI